MQKYSIKTVGVVLHWKVYLLRGSAHMKPLCVVPVPQNDVKFLQGTPLQLYKAVLGAAGPGLAVPAQEAF